MTFLFAHWWTLPSLTVAAFLFGVSIAGLVMLGEREPEDREAGLLSPPPRLDSEASTSPVRVLTDSPSRSLNNTAGGFFDGDAAA